MNIKFMVLCSIGNEQRIANVEILKQQIPQLNVIMASRETVLKEHINSFNIEDEYDGMLMLEDDVLLCKNFLSRLDDTLKGHENELVSMFESACAKGELHAGYKKGRNFAWNQCNYYPKHICRLLGDPNMLPQFREYFFEKKLGAWVYPIDTYIAYVLNLYKIDYYMALPFLVQHLEFKSNFKGRPLRRQSKYFIDDLPEYNK